MTATTLHHCLEAVHDDEGRGRHAHAGAGSDRYQGCDQARVVHKPRLFSDNEPVTSPANWQEWLEEQSMASPSDRRARIRRRHLLQVLNVDDSLEEVREKSSIEVVQTNFQHNDMRDTGPDEAKASIGDMFDKFLEDDITLGAIETKASPEMTDPGPVTRAGWTDAQDRRTSRFSVVRDSGAALATAHQVNSAVPDCCRDRSRNGRRRRARSLLVQADTDPRHNNCQRLGCSFICLRLRVGTVVSDRYAHPLASAAHVYARPSLLIRHM